MINSLDACERSPDSIKRVYKKYQKLTPEAIQTDPTILDLRRGLSNKQQCEVRKVGSVLPCSINSASLWLGLAESLKNVGSSVDVPVFETEAVPGEP